MYNFVTLFDKNYLSRGLALYHSLLENCNTFVLFVLAIDEETENYLSSKISDTLRVISLSSVEEKYPELLTKKQERTRGEYCWTLTPFSILYVIDAFSLDSCIYIDSDIYFFDNPKYIFENIGDSSIIITEHRYTPEYDQTYTSGKYCVQFVFFRNNSYGLTALKWWKERCSEWCYDRFEDGKFGDQKYLDDWLSRFKGVHIPSHIGCGLAPWNIQQYNIGIDTNKLFVEDKITKVKENIIFYHFHNLKKIFENNEKVIWHLSDYKINESINQCLYSEYVNVLYDIEKEIKGKRFIQTKYKKVKKTSFHFVALLVIKNIIKSFFIFRNYKYYRKKINEEYLQHELNTIEIEKRIYKNNSATLHKAVQQSQ
jgi:hypothetical protein